VRFHPRLSDVTAPADISQGRKLKLLAEPMRSRTSLISSVAPQRTISRKELHTFGSLPCYYIKLLWE